MSRPILTENLPGKVRNLERSARDLGFDIHAYLAPIAGFWRSPANQSVANDTNVPVTWGTTGYNYGDIVDSANSRFLIPADGIYIVTAKFVYGANANGDRSIGIYTDGGLDMWKYFRPPLATVGAEDMLTFHPKLTAGQVLTFKWWHNSGSTLTGCFAEMYCTRVAPL